MNKIKMIAPSPKNTFQGLALCAAGFLLIFWPLLLINNFTQYPECIARDILPEFPGRPSMTLALFNLIHILSAIFGAIAISIGITKFGEKSSIGRVVFYSVCILTVTFIIYVLVQFAGLSLSGVSCRDYNPLF